jgi:hypothetical protein
MRSANQQLGMSNLQQRIKAIGSISCNPSSIFLKTGMPTCSITLCHFTAILSLKKTRAAK